MLKRILDTTKIDMDNSTIQSELNTDLRRMDHLSHDKVPEGTNAYKVTVEPSEKTYGAFHHRFRFEIQYGKLDGDKFIPLGKPKKTQSEALPMI